MKDITNDACRAFMAAKPFRRSNTEVIVLDNVTIMKLFDNSIAYRYNDPERTLSITNCGWKTATTKERLNGIDGVRIHQRKGDWYLNGEKWNGELIDLN